MIKDDQIGGYSTTINISSDIATTGKYPYCLATPVYPGGFPLVAAKVVNNKTIQLSCNTNVKGGWVQWMYINKI